MNQPLRVVLAGLQVWLTILLLVNYNFTFKVYLYFSIETLVIKHMVRFQV